MSGQKWWVKLGKGGRERIISESGDDDSENGRRRNKTKEAEAE